MAKHRDNKRKVYRHKVSNYIKLMNNIKLEWCLKVVKQYIENNKNE